MYKQCNQSVSFILQSLLQPELASCSLAQSSPTGGSGTILHQLLNEEDRSPPLVSSSTSCSQQQTPSSAEVSSTAYHSYPYGSTPATPSPTSSGVPVSGGKRRQSVPCDGPIPSKQLSSPSMVGSTTSPSSVLVQLLRKDSSHTPTLPTSIATSPLDKLAKENKEKRQDTRHRISTTMAEKLNRSRSGQGSKTTPAQQNAAVTSATQAPVSSCGPVPSTTTDPSGPVPAPGHMDRFGSPGHSQQSEPLSYGGGQPVPYPSHYDGAVHPSYIFHNGGQPGMPMPSRGIQIVPARRMVHPKMVMQYPPEQGYPYGSRGPLPGMYGMMPGMRQPMSAPPFMQGYPAVSPMVPHPGTPYAPRGQVPATVFNFEETGYSYGGGLRMGSPCAQTTPRPQLAADVMQGETMVPGLSRQSSVVERQISYGKLLLLLFLKEH